LVDPPNIGQRYVLDIRFDLELASFLYISELFLGEPILEGIFLLSDHLLLISDIVDLSSSDRREHALGKFELK
jgi:hypothetical protein